MSDQPPSPPKPRGAPRGNKNAIKHGFYARQYEKDEIADLKSAPLKGVKDEVDMLRIYMRRVVELSANTEDLEVALAVLRGLSLAAFSLARLVTLNSQVLPSLDTLAEEYLNDVKARALQMVQVEMGLIPPDGKPIPFPESPGKTIGVV